MLLVGGGSGVVPLMAMLRHRRRTMPELPMRLLYSVRTGDDVIYADELGAEATLTFTRRPPDQWTGHTGRISPDMIEGALADGVGTAFLCGSNGFVEAAAEQVMAAGFEPGADQDRALRPHRLRASRARRWVGLARELRDPVGGEGGHPHAGLVHRHAHRLGADLLALGHPAARVDADRLARARRA